jgi:sulfatase maturation enzyme AslB (radical SAM superfamily)
MQWHSPVLIPFLTLSCNFACSYCITRYAPNHNLKFNRLPGASWFDLFNCAHNVTDIIFNGGEPTLHPDFPDIINRLKPLKLLAIGTNYSSLATESLLRITPRPDLIIDGSFHPDFISHQDISKNLLRLKAAGLRVRVHPINHPTFTGLLPAWLHAFQTQAIDSFIQQYEGFWEGNLLPDSSKLPACSLKSTRRVNCTRSAYTPIAPDGNVYFCHYLMYSQNQDGIIGHISNPQLSFPDSLECRHYGHCNPCDFPRTVHEL